MAGSASSETVEEGVLVKVDTVEEGGLVKEGDTVNEGCLVKEGGLVKGDTVKEGCLVKGDTVKEGGVVKGDTVKEGCLVKGDTVKEGCLVSGDTVKEGGLVMGDSVKGGGLVMKGGTVQEGGLVMKGSTVQEGGSVKGDSVKGRGLVMKGGTVQEGGLVMKGGTVQEGGSVMKGGTVEASKGPMLCMGGRTVSVHSDRERGPFLEVLSTDKAAGISMPLSEVPNKATDTKAVGENEDQAVVPQAAGAIEEKVLLTPPDHMLVLKFDLVDRITYADACSYFNRYDGFTDFFFCDVQVKGAQPDTAVVVFDSSDPVTEVLNGQRLINLGNNKVVYAKPFTSLADL